MSSPETVARYGLIRPGMGDALVAMHRAHGPNAFAITFGDRWPDAEHY